MKGGDGRLRNTICKDIDAKKKTAEKGGRPSAYRKIYAEQVQSLILLGAEKQKEIAEFFGVSEPTISGWKRDHPEFKRAIEQGKLMMGVEIVGVARKMAAGKYTHTNTMLVYDKEKCKLKTVKEKYTPAPDAGLAKYFMDKQFPGAFPNKSSLEVTTPDGIDVSIKVVGE